jgi:DNA-binding GntR family transcriptional regulator
LTLGPTCATLWPVSDDNGALIFKSRAEQAVEARFGEPVETVLRRLYFDERLSQEQVAERLGVGRQTVIRWFAKYDLVGRHPREFVA